MKDEIRLFFSSLHELLKCDDPLGPPFEAEIKFYSLLDQIRNSLSVTNADIYRAFALDVMHDIAKFLWGRRLDRRWIPSFECEVKDRLIAENINQNQMVGDFIIRDDTLVRYCGKEEDVIVPPGIRKIAYRAFAECITVDSVYLPDSLSEIDAYAFCNCVKLTSIILPKGITFLSDGIFGGCISLREVFLPELLEKIGKSAFYNCKSLTYIELPPTVTFIDEGAFERCTGLTKVKISGHLQKISSMAFSRCERLRDIRIPDDVTYIAKDAFKYCYDLFWLLEGRGNKHSDEIPYERTEPFQNLTSDDYIAVYNCNQTAEQELSKMKEDLPGEKPVNECQTETKRIQAELMAELEQLLSVDFVRPDVKDFCYRFLDYNYKLIEADEWGYTKFAVNLLHRIIEIPGSNHDYYYEIHFLEEAVWSRLKRGQGLLFYLIDADEEE